jgi:hypothetical protein
MALHAARRERVLGPADAAPTPIDGVQGLVGALPEAVRAMREADATLRGATRLKVTVDDGLFAWLRLEGPFWRIDAAQIRLLAAARAADLLGVAQEELAVACATQADGRTLLACVIDAAWPQAIASAASASGLALGSLRPAWADRLARLRVPGRDAIVARRDASAVRWAVRLGGAWIAMGSEPLDERSGDWPLRVDALVRVQVPGAAELPRWFDGEPEAAPSGWRVAGGAR